MMYGLAIAEEPLCHQMAFQPKNLQDNYAIIKHFKLEEFEKSMTATRKGIENKAGSGEIKNLTDLCYGVLEPVRAKFDKPIIITSGYRSPELCEAIGSKPTSQHTKGEAADFELAGVSNLQVALWISNNCDFDQLILEYWKDDDPNSWLGSL